MSQGKGNFGNRPGGGHGSRPGGSSGGGGRGSSGYSHGSYSSGGGKQRTFKDSTVLVLFDPKLKLADLVDTLAEQQAELLKINSAQLRRFFGEIKTLYRQYQSLSEGKPAAEKQTRFEEQIQAPFQMVRSKVAYASKTSNAKIEPDFAKYMYDSIGKVNTAADFEKFVLHLEAVVGFMYGLERVTK